MADWVPGADISNYQHLTPQSARALKAEGVGMVIVRASHERQALIDTALAQMQMVVDAGMQLHAYGWVYFTEAPAATAQRWRQLYEDQPIGRFWLDVEDPKYVGSPAHNEAWLQEALSVLGEQWPVGIYSGPWYWVPYMGNSSNFSNLPLWDADYTNAPNLHPARLYGGWTQRAIHQYTGNGSLAGISPLDLDAVDPALLGEEEDMGQMAEVQRIAREEIIRNVQSAVENIDRALAYRRLPADARAVLETARTNLASGAWPAAETLARGLQPGEGDGSG